MLKIKIHASEELTSSLTLDCLFLSNLCVFAAVDGSSGDVRETYQERIQTMISSKSCISIFIMNNWLTDNIGKSYVPFRHGRIK